ncbi:hypothetical protein FDW83_08120 [Pseudarthrobacter sp. NamE2]|uniref:hypothetical protein n=1 Tax=Pseudarthrobacter sp. NamE2 TaxID=2576838 RepID=UPI0010FE3950|nr:hypothetical protein [Pseudarthrobacter sp. NamE2]TLM83936.1 hypothetical protein FDW83_08120 [Pseudarthrobacter sp. NamE2]
MEIVQGIWAAVAGAAALAPLATFGVVLVAYLAYRQKDRADRRDQWWKRAEWAIDSALNDADPQRRLAGLKVLVQLIGSDLATAEDADLMSALAVGILQKEGAADARRSAAAAASNADWIVREAQRLLEAAAARSRSA